MRDSKLAQLDAGTVEAARTVRVLDALAWDPAAEPRFLEAWRAGRRELPRPGVAPRDLSREVATLQDIAARCDSGNPLESFVAATARSYATAFRMLGTIGTPEFTQRSIELYRRPDETYRTQGIGPLDAARFFLSVTEELLGNCVIPATVPTIEAAEFKGWLEGQLAAFFHLDEVAVVLDRGITAKALASASRVRIRDGVLFSELDHQQLFQHEALVHAATMLNGRRQTKLGCMALGASRTTRTQEGLAVFAEIITESMDIARLRRIAQRVIGVKQALDGADFLEVFESFLAGGQSEVEAYRSAQRVFRSGHLTGGAPYTKDAVYLAGVLEVHTFLRVAIRDNRPELIRHLFAGRLTLGDVVRLAPFFDSGQLAEPVYVPPWAADLRRLAATLAYSAFLTHIKLGRVDLQNFVDFEERPSVVREPGAKA